MSFSFSLEIHKDLARWNEHRDIEIPSTSNVFLKLFFYCFLLDFVGVLFCCYALPSIRRGAITSGICGRVFFPLNFVVSKLW
jgi:hypothetical protein